MLVVDVAAKGCTKSRRSPGVTNAALGSGVGGCDGDRVRGGVQLTLALVWWGSKRRKWQCHKSAISYG
jgi:hypothetical protein